MDQLGGPVGLIAIIVVVALLLLLAVLHFGFGIFRRRKGKGGRGRASAVLRESRVEVLETTPIDDERRLVLIRCDKIEHLIMVGGPADVVVENDVRKVRGAGAPPAKIPGIEDRSLSPARSAPPTPSPLAASPVVPAPKAPEPARPGPRAGDVRPQPAPSRPPSVTPPPRPARSDIPPPAVRADDRRTPPARQQPAEPPRRDVAASAQRRKPGSASPAPPLRAGDSSRTAPVPVADRNPRVTRATGRPEPAALPAAQIPWTDPDSIENEIVRALRFEPQGRAPASPRDVPKPTIDPNATLGDLADRLEEALAREVQASNSAAPESDDFGFDNDAEVAKPEATKSPRQEMRRERPEPPRAQPTAGSEGDGKREPAAGERREEAPVISLNSRRRESSDQLEDEMARLLGELTSDTKGR